MIKKHGINIRPGMTITGKWHQHKYVVIKQLGSGSIGTVYLCESEGKYVALKMSDLSTSITIEVNVLKELDKVQGNRLGPYLIEVDDWVSADGTFPFYVMEYLHGTTIRHFIQKNGQHWIGVIMLQLLDGLAGLHESGWVFGDLKAENLLMVDSPPRIRWVDVGGTTRIGRAIKEYTEFYDRGYWGMGTRKAEPSYDLFAFVMVFLSIYYPKHFQRTNQPKQTIFQKIDQIKSLKPYRACFKKAIVGAYATSSQMKNDLLKIVNHSQRNRQRTKNKQQGSRFIEVVGITLISLTYLIIAWFSF